MPATAVHALRYPAPADPADVPTDMQNLANDVDVALLPANTVAAAATRVIANLLAAADANPAWRVLGDGHMDWGAGGASAPDTNLYRGGAGQLQTDGTFYMHGTSAWFAIDNQTQPYYNAFYLKAGADSQWRFVLRTDGLMTWGPGGATAGDTTLYRSAASYLRTDGRFGIYVGAGATAFDIGVTGDTQPRLYSDSNGKLNWGPGGPTLTDTTLYRAAAGLLRTDSSLQAAGAYNGSGSGSGNMWVLRVSSPSDSRAHAEANYGATDVGGNASYSYVVPYVTNAFPVMVQQDTSFLSTGQIVSSVTTGFTVKTGHADNTPASVYFYWVSVGS